MNTKITNLVGLNCKCEIPVTFYKTAVYVVKRIKSTNQYSGIFSWVKVTIGIKVFFPNQ